MVRVPMMSRKCALATEGRERDAVMEIKSHLGRPLHDSWEVPRELSPHLLQKAHRRLSVVEHVARNVRPSQQCVLGAGGDCRLAVPCCLAEVAGRAHQVHLRANIDIHFQQQGLPHAQQGAPRSVDAAVQAEGRAVRADRGAEPPRGAQAVHPVHALPVVTALCLLSAFVIECSLLHAFLPCWTLHSVGRVSCWLRVFATERSLT
jgi:hypothetical protein